MTEVNESIRARMLADMELANYSPRTVTEYLRCCDKFVEHYMRGPEELGETEVRCYLLYLLKKWVTYAKRPFAGPRQVFRYLGLYTHRVGISNHRLRLDPPRLRAGGIARALVATDCQRLPRRRGPDRLRRGRRQEAPGATGDVRPVPSNVMG